MLGLTMPDEGSISIMGNDPKSRAARNLTGYVAQDSDFPSNLTVREIINLVRSHFQRPRSTDELISDFGLEELADRYTGGFSGGQRRRLALALAFAGQGKIVFLDEPTTGLDARGRKVFWAYSKEYIESGGTLIITTHHLDEIETVADRICLINHGRVELEGSVVQIKRRVGRKYVRFTCASLPELSPVLQIDKQGGVYQIMTTDAEEVVRQLVLSGEIFGELEIRSASLEEAIENHTSMNEKSN